MRLMVTGHRPDKLWGYDDDNENYDIMKENFKKIILGLNVDECTTGMALGVDTVFAKAVLDLKADRHNIKLNCVLPCKNQESRWSRHDRELYWKILELADTVHYVSARYTSWCMQKRNEYMVDNNDFCLAIWDGTNGGTANCVRYAKERGLDPIVIEPEKIKNPDIEFYDYIL